VYSTDKNYAAPTDAAFTALVSDANIEVQRDDWLVMKPTGAMPTGGVILYPGANCDIAGYAPVLRDIAADGYLVVVVSMPFDFAIFAPDRADEVRAAFPEVRDWVIAGHSMGGAMAGRYAFNHQDDLAGLIMWDSYPPASNSLADATLPVLHIHRADADGIPPQKFLDTRNLYPADSVWVPVPGGAHMFFGSFDGGGYVEERAPTISRGEQHEIVIPAMRAGLSRMLGDATERS
jgi:pimeloyl-ACP methyl ester carboxylesterase